MMQGGVVAYFYYDSNNSVTAMSINDSMYYYVKNLQGDITKIVNHQGKVMVEYTYDAWGNILKEKSNVIPSYATVKDFNPFRYRGYVYDTDTGLYYLQSRYYDPKTGRFINADDTAYVDTNSGTPLSTNMFAYCENDAVNGVDYNGYRAINISYKLLGLMMSNAGYLYRYACRQGKRGYLGKINILHKFYKLVKTGGKWDLKNKSAWKLKSKKDYYIFFKDKLTAEDVGNVHFGFVGSVLFSSVTLCTGAGIYQIISGTSDWKYWKSFFDDPRDTRCILIGHSYWSHYYSKYRFQW